MTVREELNRVKIALKLKTDQELADTIGTNKNNVDSWVKRDVIPNKWRLVMGGLVSPAKLPLNYSKRDTVELNYYPEVIASAGYGCTNDELESETINVSRFFIESLHVTNTNKLDVIRVYGDSMEPDFLNGEYVVVERVDTVEQVNNGNTVIANIEGNTYIKKIEKIPFEETIVLHSTNNTYHPITIKSKDMKALNLVGIVRGALRAV